VDEYTFVWEMLEMDDADIDFMRRALALARQGRGRVEPNPMVGAVVVKDGRIVGEGFHQSFGGPHAEVHALDAAGDQSAGGTLYVTLEPCCHQGKTPPCTQRVIASGVRRVVAAMLDPFEAVAGRGLEELRSAGMEVVAPCLEDEARELNAAYLTLLKEGRPFVHLKWAMSLDGRIATRGGESKWITSAAAREHSHRFRGEVDAILVGIGTVLADDPMLTPRLPDGAEPHRYPARVVLDSRARLRSDTQLARTAREHRTLVATTNMARPADISRLTALGCECLLFRPTPDGRVPLHELLGALGRQRMTHLLVEGGSETVGAFVDARLVDAFRIYLAPMVLGGQEALPAVGGMGAELLSNALSFRFLPPVSLGPDLFLEGVRGMPPAGSNHSRDPVAGAVRASPSLPS
jgi:diaminohydroxyphosphoribosylaminopyrimidine deaminase/5-amino-6-(5-phosphoribosylamino)uracil reductase